MLFLSMYPVHGYVILIHVLGYMAMLFLSMYPVHGYVILIHVPSTEYSIHVLAHCVPSGRSVPV